MKKIHVTMASGFCNAYYEEYFDFEDDATEDEIEATVEEWEENVKSEMTPEWEEVEEEEE